MRDAAAMAAFSEHGGRIAHARSLFGDRDRGDGDWIDLSTGIAPWPYPALAADPAALARLPDPAALAALERSAGVAFGAAPGREVVAVPGSELAMRLLAGVIGARAPAVVQPGYSGHSAAWPDAMPIAADALVAAGRTHDLLVVANPGNPDGRHIAAAELARATADEAMLVVDEAFADAMPAQSLAGSPDARIVVLRSFGKFYGLPGLRLGFVLAAPDIARRLRAVLGDWPVSAPAIAIGTAAYRDAAWRGAQRARIAAAGDRLDAALARGAAIRGATPLFRLIGTGDAAGLFRHLAGHGILTRPFAGRPGWLRIGLPVDAAASARLAHALEGYRR